MRQKSGPVKESAEKVVKDIRRATRRHFSAEEEISALSWKGLRGEESIVELCRREGIVQNLYYRWSEGFSRSRQEAAGGRHGAGRDLGRGQGFLRREASTLKEVVAELTLENRLLKKHDGGWAQQSR